VYNFAVAVLRSLLYFQIHWQDFLEAVFTGVDVTFNSQERVVVREVQYLSDLVTLLDNTPHRVIGRLKQNIFFTL
jgi:hypothetical protein